MGKGMRDGRGEEGVCKDGDRKRRGQGLIYDDAPGWQRKGGEEDREGRMNERGEERGRWRDVEGDRKEVGDRPLSAVIL